VECGSGRWPLTDPGAVPSVAGPVAEGEGSCRRGGVFLGNMMATHRFHPTRYYNVIGTAEPCLRVADGDTVTADTIDASRLDAREVAVAERGNPMTGRSTWRGRSRGTRWRCASTG